MKIVRFFIIAYCLFALYTCIDGQSPADLSRSRAFERSALASYRAKDYAAFLRDIKQAADLRPDLPRLIYNLAGAYALNGNPDESVALIDRLIAMGVFFDFEKDDDFASLGASRLMEIGKRARANNVATNSSPRAFTLPDREMIPEGIAYDPVSRRFFVGSIHQGRIVSVDQNGRSVDFSAPNDGLWSVSGMAVDADRRILWATTSSFPQFAGYKPSEKGRAGMFKYDLNTGKLLDKFFAPAGDGEHALGDLTLGRSGRVYITDSISPVIYTIAPNGKVLETFIRDETFSSLNGITFDTSGNSLYVSDYTNGVYRIDVLSKKFVQIKPSKNVTLIGIDGLYFFRGDLIATQNGVSPQRVVRFSLNPTKTEITAFRTLEANHPDFLEPTLGVIVKGDLFCVANSQWPLIDEKGVFATDKLREPIVLKLKL